MWQAHDDAAPAAVASLIFQFSGGHHLALTVDDDTDELVWTHTTDHVENFIDLATRCPAVARGWGGRIREVVGGGCILDIVCIGICNVGRWGSCSCRMRE